MQKERVSTKNILAMLDVETLIEASSLEKQYNQLPNSRSYTDLAIVVDDNVYVADLMAAIQEKAENSWNMNLFDVYKGEQVPEGKRVLRLLYLSDQMTELLRMKM